MPLVNTLTSAFKNAEQAGTITGLREVEIAGRRLLFFIFFVILLMGISVSLTGNGWTEAVQVFLRAVCMALVLAIASASVGSVLGFLFGIPKLLQKGGPPNQDAGRASVSGHNQFFITNTSLEEISDWLTKIIIGIGLVQFQTIMHYFYAAALVCSSYVGSTAVTLPVPETSAIAPAATVGFFFAIMVGCLLTSCLFVYLQTRTRLTMMFLKVETAKADSGAFRQSMTPSLLVDNDTPTDNRSSTPTDLVPPTTADDGLLAVPREQLKSATDIAGWAAAQARAGNTQASEDAFRDALQRDPSNIDILLRLAEVRRFRGNQLGFVDCVLEILSKSSSPRKDVISAATWAQLESLYLPPPQGFEKAIAISSFLEDVDLKKRAAIVSLRRACAYGQKFAYLGDKTMPEAVETRASALSAVLDVVRSAPDSNDRVRVTMRQVYDPLRFKGKPQDNDLEVFKGDPNFEEAIVGEH